MKNYDVKDVEREKLRFLLEQKIACVNMAGNACMAWWVSSVVFCGSIMAGVWLERKELIKSNIFYPLGVALGFFFAGVVLFGVLMTWRYLCNLGKDMSVLEKLYLGNPGKEISALKKKLKIKTFFFTELSTFKWAMVIGTVSFFFILVLWIGFLLGQALGWWNLET